MKKAITHVMICGVLTALLAVSCGEDSPVTTDNHNPPPEPVVLPVVPVPQTPTDPLPSSPRRGRGALEPLRSFVPMVERMCQMKDDASMVWTTENRRLKLVCNDGVLAEPCAIRRRSSALTSLRARACCTSGTGSS